LWAEGEAIQNCSADPDRFVADAAREDEQRRSLQG